MDLNKILEYQSLDAKLFAIEKKLRDNQDKKVASQMSASAKDAQMRSVALEKQAGDLAREIETIKGQVESQNAKLDQMKAKNVDTLTKEEIDNYAVIKDKLASNLNILDKNLTKLAERVNAVLADFNKTIKVYNMAKEKFTQSKAAYDNAAKAVEPEKVELEKKLATLSKSVDSAIMQKYAKRRSDNIFPVLVPLDGRSCGGCRMELPAAEISKLEREGLLTCEHCHRLIYKK